MVFNYVIDDERVSFREIKVKEYKNLLKIIYGDDIDYISFHEYITFLLSSISDKEQSFFKNLSIVDLFSCIIYLKCNTSGNNLELDLSNKETKRTISLNLNLLQEDLSDVVSTKVNSIINCGQVSIQMKCPTYERLTEKIDEEYLYFIRKVTIDDKSIEIITNQQAQEIFEQLPIKAALEIIKHFENIVDVFGKLNFFDRYKISEQILNFVPSKETIAWYTKLFFSEPLDVFYDNLFYLSYFGHMSTEYIENCTPGEYTYFVKKLEYTLAKQNSSSEQTDNNEQHYVDEQEINN